MPSDILVVIPHVNDDYPLAKFHWGNPKVDVLTVDTSTGGYPTGAIKMVYHSYITYWAYLFVQDSMWPTSPDYLDDFLDSGYRVMAWATFPLGFDSDEQKHYVKDQYPGVEVDRGIFGPVFYSERSAMTQAEPFFPATPLNRMEAQGTERAWAYCFEAAGVPFGAIRHADPRELHGVIPPLRKEYAGRP